MWPIIQLLVRRSPYVTLPFAAVIGFFGYHLEGWISDKYTPASEPVNQQREERLLENIDSLSTKSKPGKHNPLEVNLSPSLS